MNKCVGLVVLAGYKRVRYVLASIILNGGGCARPRSMTGLTFRNRIRRFGIASGALLSSICQLGASIFQSSRTRSRLAVLSLTATICVTVFAVAAKAQEVSMIGQAGTSVPGSYQPGGIDTINLQNGAVVLNIPILSYPQLGDKLKLSFSLKYSPTAWVYSTGAPGIVSSVPHLEYTGTWTNYYPQVSNPIGVTLVRDQAVVATQFGLNYICSTGGTFNCPPPQNNSQAAEERISAVLYSLVTADRAVHNFGISGDGGHFTFLPTLDGSNFVPVGSGPLPPTTFLGPNGVTYNEVQGNADPNLNGGFNQTDPDGNTINISSTGWTDSIGRQIPGSNGTGDGNLALFTPGDPIPGVTSADLSRCSPGTSAARIWNVPGPNGGTSTYTLCFKWQTATTAFAVLNLQPAVDSAFTTAQNGQGSGTYLLLTQLVLPNGTSYSFTYDSWLELQSITLPTGGSISYGWVTMQWATVDVSHQQSRVVSTRTVHNTDGTSYTWNYTLTQLAPGTTGPLGSTYLSMLITDPAQNDETHDFSFTEPPPGNILRPTETINYYNGTGASRKLLKTITLVSEQIFNPFIYPENPEHFNPASVLPGPVLSQTTTWPDTTQVSQTTYSITPGSGSFTYYNFNENVGPALGTHIYTAQTCSACWSTLQPQTVSEYDYGNGQPGPLLRTTTTIYQWQQASAYQTANLISQPYQETVTDGSGTQVAQTTYGYDENNGSPQGARGHLTSTTHWNNVGPSPKSQTVYNAQGMPTLSIDPNGNQSFISSYQCSGIFPQVVITPYKSPSTVAETTTFGYDCNTGVLTSVQDANNQTTSYAYADLLGRLTGITYPDHGSVAISYNGDPTPPQLTRTTATGEPGGPRVEKTVYDGFGRVVQTQLQSDPAGTDFTDITYDGLGRIISVSNPHRSSSSPSDGTTSFAYDALSRKTLQCQQDNGTVGTCQSGASYLQWSYSGNVTTYFDETRRSWSRTSDALGRLTKVLEPSSTSPSPSMETDYTYDALNNLRSVNQCGGACPSTGAVARSFTYNSLSQLIQAFNPEAGWVCYGTTGGAAANGTNCTSGYDANGNLGYKTDARGFTTNYCYDALNRLTGKSYQQNSCLISPSYRYVYDQYQTSDICSGCSAASLFTSSSSIGRMTESYGSDNKSHAVYAYDSMGRITAKGSCFSASGACSSGANFGQPLQYTYDLAGDPTSTTNGIPSPGFLLTYGYDGAGRLNSLTSNWVGDPLHPGTLLNATTTSPAAYDPFGNLNYASFGIVDSNSPKFYLNQTHDNRDRVSQKIYTTNQPW